MGFIRRDDGGWRAPRVARGYRRRGGHRPRRRRSACRPRGRAAAPASPASPGARAAGRRNAAGPGGDRRRGRLVVERPLAGRRRGAGEIEGAQASGARSRCRRASPRSGRRARPRVDLGRQGRDVVGSSASSAIEAAMARGSMVGKSPCPLTTTRGGSRDRALRRFGDAVRAGGVVGAGHHRRPRPPRPPRRSQMSRSPPRPGRSPASRPAARPARSSVRRRCRRAACRATAGAEAGGNEDERIGHAGHGQGPASLARRRARVIGAVFPCAAGRRRAWRGTAFDHLTAKPPRAPLSEPARCG